MLMPSELQQHANDLATAMIARDAQQLQRLQMLRKMKKIDRENLANMTMVEIFRRELKGISDLETRLDAQQMHQQCVNGFLDC